MINKLWSFLSYFPILVNHTNGKKKKIRIQFDFTCYDTNDKLNFKTEGYRLSNMQYNTVIFFTRILYTGKHIPVASENCILRHEAKTAKWGGNNHM